MSWWFTAGLVVVGAVAFAAGMIVEAVYQRARMKRVLEAARELAAGNLAHRVIMAGDDRTARIAEALNTLADSFQAEREAAANRDRAQKRFMSNISHDLRTPITSIAGYVDALERGLGDEPERYLSVIAAKSEDLAQLTDDLFFAARLDADDLELTLAPLDLAEAVRRSVLGFEPQLAAGGVQVNVELPDEPCLVDADSSAVVRILSNLISNSIRHAPEMTTFRVGLLPASEDFVVRVSNDGARLPDEPESLFERGSAGPGGGAGIGLSIARELAERMGASLGASSSPEGHAQFTLTFPRSVAASSAAVAAAPAKFKET